jgi:hypothetical protein
MSSQVGWATHVDTQVCNIQKISSKLQLTQALVQSALNTRVFSEDVKFLIEPSLLRRSKEKNETILPGDGTVKG